MRSFSKLSNKVWGLEGCSPFCPLYSRPKNDHLDFASREQARDLSLISLLIYKGMDGREILQIPLGLCEERKLI